MDINRLDNNDVNKLRKLLDEYKKSIGEEQLTDEAFNRLKEAVKEDKITFYVAKDKENIIAMCSITIGFSTFNCSPKGIFEDFYIEPSYRGKGIASKLTQFVFSEMESQGVKSVWVGCSDIDVDMYKHLGFEIELGNLLAWSMC